MTTLSRCTAFPPKLLPVLTCLLLISLPEAAHGDGGVTFTDIAADDGAGIMYRRQESLTEGFAAALRQLSSVSLEEIVLYPFDSRGVPGVAVLDFDHDGDLDLYVTNGPGADNSLYSNQLIESGNVTFIDVAAAAGVAATDHDSSGVCYGDIDNDGDHDLLVLSHFGRNRLFENQDDASGSAPIFLDISAASGVGEGAASSTSCAMGDVNGDGLLDVVIGNSSDITTFVPMREEFFTFNESNQLLLNQGDNIFADATAVSGILDVAVAAEAPPGAATITRTTALVDIDLDGDVDFLHADDQAELPGALEGGLDRGYVQIFENDGTGFFTNATIERRMAITGRWKGLAFADFDRDGLLDLFATNFGNHARAQQRGGDLGLEERDSRWFLQRSDGTFADSSTRRSRNTPIGSGTAAADYDNDGDTDILYHGGFDLGLGVVAAPGTILVNDGGANFRRDAAALADSTGHVRRTVHGMAIGDLDSNGFVDIVSVSNFDLPAALPLEPMSQLGGEFDHDIFFAPTFVPLAPGLFTGSGLEMPDGTLAVELNGGENRNAWVQVEVKGSVGFTPGGRVNRDGIGAVVRCQPRGKPAVLLPVLSGSSYASQSSLIQSCGLGRAREAVIDVQWPGGVRNRIYQVGAGERVLFPEIPCSFDDPNLSRSEYIGCVRVALEDLEEAGIVGPERKRLLLDHAVRAYSETRLAGRRLEGIEVAVRQRSFAATPEIITYPSSITSDANGPLDLRAELNYNAEVLGAPIAVVMHGFSPSGSISDPVNLDDVRANAQRLCDSGFFAISVAMRQRDGSDGVRDSGGIEIYDIYDAVEYVKANYSQVDVDASNVHITGYSGGGGNVMSALTKFPDYFRLGSSFFGMSDYGFDPSFGWYQNGASPNHQSLLDTDVGDPGSGNLLIEDKYAARASNLASKNNPYSEIHLFVNSNETISPPLHHDSYRDFAVASETFPGEFGNITVHTGDPTGATCEDFNMNSICDLGERQNWPHHFPSAEEQLAAENWYLDRLLNGNIPEPKLNQTDELYVAGYVKTKPFSLWLGDGQNAAGNLSYSLRDNIKEFFLDITTNDTAVGGVLKADTSDMAGQVLRAKIDGEIVGEFVGGSESMYSMQDNEKLQVHVKDVPVANWKLNETSGTTANDSSSYGNHGILEGSSTTAFDFLTKGVRGKIGGALEFDGDDDLIELGSIDNANPLMLADSDFSISVWINQSDNSGDRAQRIVEKSNGGGDAAGGYALWVDKFYIGISVAGATRAKTPNPGIYGQWFHLAVTMTTTEGHIYINGIDQTPLAVHDPALPPESEEAMRIGSWTKNATGREFKGLMDDLKIFNYALAGDEVSELLFVPPVANWKLDEKMGTVSVDTSDYHNDGDLGGTTFDFSTALGKVGRALEFDGDDDLVELGVIDSTNPLMLSGSDFSISVWINQPDNLGDRAQRIVEKSNGGGNAGGGYALWVDKFYIGVSVAGATRVKIPNPDIYGQWIHLAVTMTATEAHIYINGIDQTPLTVHDPALPPESEEVMRIGSWTKNATGREFKGLMDDLKILDYALTEGEVNELLIVPPIAHWSFDETSGTVGSDLSGYDNNGDLEGPSTTAFDFSTKGVPGRVGRALDFDGDDDLIELNVIDSVNPLMLTDSDFSISVWINQTDDSGDGAQRIVEKSNGGGNAGGGYALWVDRFYIGISVAGATRAKIPNPSIYGQWIHLAVTMTATEGHIYINGIDQTPLTVHDPALPPESEEAMRIGSWTKNATGREFKGSMDDLRIYNRALSQTEVSELSAVP